MIGGVFALLAAGIGGAVKRTSPISLFPVVLLTLLGALVPRVLKLIISVGCRSLSFLDLPSRHAADAVFLSDGDAGGADSPDSPEGIF